LKTESIASSKVEGLGLGVRELSHAEARLDTGDGKVSSTALEVIGNIEAIEILDAAGATQFTVVDIQMMHERLMLKSSHPHLAGRIRDVQNWIRQRLQSVRSGFCPAAARRRRVVAA
jgi:Fic family protein